MTRAELERSYALRAHSERVDEHTLACEVIDGSTLFVDSRDKSIAPHLARDGYWESWITLAILRAIQPGDHFLDVGANVGWYCMVARAAKAAVISAVEPSPRLADLLVRTFMKNGLDTGRVYRMAAWNRSAETLQLEQNVENFGGMSVLADRFETISVPSIRLDDLVDRADVIKIDVEGAELKVWEGMERIRKTARRIFMEFTPASHQNALDALRAIQNDGFVVNAVQFDGSSESVDVRRLSVMADWVMLDLRRIA